MRPGDNCRVKAGTKVGTTESTTNVSNTTLAAATTY